MHTSPQSHRLQRHIADPRDCETSDSSWRALGDVATSVPDSAKHPRRTQRRARRRESQARDQESAEEGSDVLDEVAVRPLRAVELEGSRALGSLLLGRVRNRVLEAAALAGLGREDEVVGVDEEGGRGDGQDVAINRKKSANVSLGLTRYHCHGSRGKDR